ncbi:BnaC04g03370D [Brassica napus]|uniref:BnaC04g03370D protein n=1 Tax=Brassica napus TaxID=3708 RepID=A0A078FYJ0_BRANA|nr:BnaC04g03370D [Brassica napus]
MSKKRAGDVSKGIHKSHGLIPGLPSELAIECLVRVPHRFQYDMKSVSRSWRSLLSDSSLTKERQRCGKAELLLCLVQPLTPPNPASKASPRVSGTPRFGLSVYNATMSTWNRVAFPDQQIPLFCECVAVQAAGKILLIGGWDLETLQPVKDVYVIELAGEGSGRRWRKGASMNEARSFFACATVGSTKVYVAGGHDDQKNALRSAEVYDVEKDEWLMLTPMTEGRDDYTVGMELGFCVLSGYGTESQGRFRSDGEVYDPVTDSWSRIENVWPFPDTCRRGRVAGEIRGSSSKLWCFTDSKRRWETEDESGKWRLDLESMQLPVTGSSVYGGSLGGEAVVMIGGGSESEGRGTMMRKTSEKWSRVHEIPFGFSTQPFSHASIYV